MSKRSLWTPDLVYPAPYMRPIRGMEKIDLLALGILPGAAGGRQGTHVAADVVTQTADGRDLNQIWSDFMDLLNAVNETRVPLINFLTFPVTQPVELVAQPGDGVEFEEASEFGEPVGARIAPTYFNMAYTFKWYDLAARYTWQYLADATAAMVDSVANAAVEAYNRKVLFEVLKTIFNPNNLQANINQQAYTVYKFYNADTTVPPPYKTNTFDGSHTHYRASGAASLDSGDVETLILEDLAKHGYSLENGYQVVIMVNRAEGDVIRTWRANQENANSAVAKYDFIPAVGQPGQIMLINQQVVGQAQPAGTLNGLNVIGAYGPALIVQDDWMPAGYLFGFATGGEASLSNPVGFREHAQTGLRGLRLVKGRNADYPLIDSFWATGFGTGIRHRGGGVVVQVTGGSYSAPAQYA